MFSQSIMCLINGGPAVPNSDIPEESFIKPSHKWQKNIIQNKVHTINKIVKCIQAYNRWTEYKALLMFSQTNHFNGIRSSFA